MKQPLLPALPLLLLLLPAVLLGAGCVTQSARTVDDEVRSISSSLMCPVCPAETVDQSQVPLAKQMQEIVREKVQAGESRQEILDFFVERYGDQVLAAPPKRGFNLIAWVVPGIGLLAGGALVAYTVRRMRRPQRGEQTNPFVSAHNGEPDGELGPYLTQVDEDLRRLLGGPGLAAEGPPGRG